MFPKVGARRLTPARPYYEYPVEAFIEARQAENAQPEKDEEVRLRSDACSNSSDGSSGPCSAGSLRFI